MHDLAHTLDAMDPTRLVLALLFIAGYASSIGHLATERGRRWSIALAALAGLSFVGLTNPWVHGALLVVFAIVGVGALIAIAWAFSVWAARQRHGEVPFAAQPTAAPGATLATSPLFAARRVRRMRRRLSAL